MVVLCTDDPGFASIVPYLFEEHIVQSFPLNQLAAVLQLAESSYHLVIGLPTLRNEDWALLDLMGIFSVSTYILVRRNISSEELRRARELGIAGFLLDPFIKLRGSNGNDLDFLFKLLSHDVAVLPSDDGTVLLGFDTYFSINQHWVEHAGQKVNLSDREANVLKLFLQYEGKILTKELIAHEIWNGLVVTGGISKLIGRIREKLGPAGALIQGRKQGGYIFVKRQA